jgi:phage-related protein
MSFAHASSKAMRAGDCQSWLRAVPIERSEIRAGRAGSSDTAWNWNFRLQTSTIIGTSDVHGDIVKRLPAAFYQLPSGREPVREWIRALDDEDRKIIGEDIKTVEFSWPIGMPLCRPLGKGLWEVRSDITDGRIARVLFCTYDGRMVLLHGFVKKTQKTPDADLQLAMKRRREIT